MYFLSSSVIQNVGFLAKKQVVKKVITYVKNCDTQPWKQGHICLVSFSPEHILLDKMAFFKRE